jgi:RNA recognition motif-containing protein
MKATEKDLAKFFGNFGKVRSVVMIRDKVRCLWI